MLAGRVIVNVLQPYLGAGPTMLLSFAGSMVIFFVVQRWLKDLRGR
jgi:hypothetical protein